MRNIVPESCLDKKRDLVHVAVAVIEKSGHALITKRPEHVHQGGLWEFPGGKVEFDEDIFDALYREIKEELGIEILNKEPLIQVVYDYDDKSVLLDTWKIKQFKGQDYPFSGDSKGLEQQPVRWVEINQLHVLNFPVANKAIVQALQLPEMYLITPDIPIAQQLLTELDLTLTSVSKPLPLIQLRLPSMPSQELEAILFQATKCIHDVNARVLLNSETLIKAGLNPDLQHRLLKTVDGLHLTAKHFSDLKYVKDLREHYPNKLLAASCHTQDDIERANRHSIDFITLSPVKMTRSHPEAVPMGWKHFADLAFCSQVPVYALGGMAPTDINQAKHSGAQGIAAIRSLWVDVF